VRPKYRLVTNELVRTMKSRMYRTLIAALGAAALIIVANESFAASRAMSRGGFTSSHLTSQRLGAHMFRHRRGPEAAFVWPGYDDSFYGPYGAYAAPIVDGAPPVPGEVQYTNGIPWDWAHRYPPIVMPSERPYVSSCPAETVTVPDGRGGEGQVNILRCY
jgi:hypothetical protein